MGLNDTPSSERVHIGIFGKRNAGKSSLINALTNQNLAIVSGVKGTTTDPVYKSMELLPIGPVVLIDTPGIDDTGELGQERVKAAKRVLGKTDVALLAVEGSGLSPEDDSLLADIRERKIPYIIVHTKSDLRAGGSGMINKDTTGSGLINKDTTGSGLINNDTGGKETMQKTAADNEIAVSAKSGENIGALRELIASRCQTGDGAKRLVADLIKPRDIVVLVIPVDEAAPKGRLILPQQQVLRDILEADGFSVVTREYCLREALSSLSAKPALVITDSQAFGRVLKDVPEDIRLTSFSILMARYKGILEQAVKGVASLERLADGDTVLISEGCTHHRQCGDIGTVKIPGWMNGYTKKKLNFRFTSGREFPEDLTGIKLVVHCGGCMLNEREMRYRMAAAGRQDVPFTNYGILIAYIHGILKRSVEPFPDVVRWIGG